MLRFSRFAAMSAVLLAVGCAGTRAPEPEPPPDPWVAANEERLKDRAEHEAEDRKELVRPAPDFWRPETRGLALRLELSLEKTTYRVGEPLRYRLEVQNVGEKEFLLHEDPSFIKTGKLMSRGYRAILTTPGEGEIRLSPPLRLFGGGPLKPADEKYAAMTAAELTAAVKRVESREWTKNKLILHLRSGETIVTRSDDAGGRYRELQTEAAFDRPGKYLLRFIFDETANYAKVHAESPPVAFEVVP
jgi:hypothetical protein